MKDQATADEDTSLKDRGLIAISMWLLCYHSITFVMVTAQTDTY